MRLSTNLGTGNLGFLVYECFGLWLKLTKSILLGILPIIFTLNPYEIPCGYWLFQEGLWILPDECLCWLKQAKFRAAIWLWQRLLLHRSQVYTSEKPESTIIRGSIFLMHNLWLLCQPPHKLNVIFVLIPTCVYLFDNLIL